MPNRRLKLRDVCFAAIFALLSAALSAEADDDLYSQAASYAKNGDFDAAFMSLHLFINNNPPPKLAEKALFSIGEYYFLKSDFFDANAAFERLIKEYPGSKEKVFALAYLLKIAQIRKNKPARDKAENEIAASKQLILLFSESKQYKYASLFGKKYKAVYFIDKVEVHIDETLFTTVSF